MLATRNANEAVVAAVFETYNRDDMNACVALVSDDFVLSDEALGMTFHGPEGFRAWLGSFKMAFPDSQTNVINLFSQGEWVAGEHIGSGTHTGLLVGPAGEVPPTGRSFSLSFGEFFKVQNGKIVFMRAYYDVSTLLRQLGVIS